MYKGLIVSSINSQRVMMTESDTCPLTELQNSVKYSANSFCQHKCFVRIGTILERVLIKIFNIEGRMIIEHMFYEVYRSG